MAPRGRGRRSGSPYPGPSARMARKRGQHGQRVPVGRVQDRAAKPELGDDDDGEQTQICRQRIAERLAVARKERRRYRFALGATMAVSSAGRCDRAARAAGPDASAASCACAAAQLLGERRAVRDRSSEDGKDQDRAFGDGRIVGRDIEDEQDVDHHHQDVGAEDGAERPPRPPPSRVPPTTTAANIDSSSGLPTSGSALPVWALMNTPARP